MAAIKQELTAWLVLRIRPRKIARRFKVIVPFLKVLNLIVPMDMSWDVKCK